MSSRAHGPDSVGRGTAALGIASAEAGAGSESIESLRPTGALEPGSQSHGRLEIESVTDAVYRRLRGAIVQGLAPGSPLRLGNISAELGVSTTPVRVALERLASDGLVQRSGRRGATVAPLSLSDFYDIYAIRTGLEGIAARIAAPALSAAAEAAMRQALSDLDYMAQNSGAIDLDAYLNTEWRMRMTCFAASGHRRLLDEIETYRRQAERYLRLVFVDSDSVLADLEYQHLFFSSCTSRDPDAAEQIAQRQLRWTVQRVAPIIQEMDHS